jgi:hypothetical protein
MPRQRPRKTSRPYAPRAAGIATERSIAEVWDRPGMRHPDGRPDCKAIAREVGRPIATVRQAIERIEARGGVAEPFDWTLDAAGQRRAAEHADLIDRATRRVIAAWRLWGDAAQVAHDGATDGLLRAARRFRGLGEFRTYAFAFAVGEAKQAVRQHTRQQADEIALIDPGLLERFACQR